VWCAVRVAPPADLDFIPLRRPLLPHGLRRPHGPLARPLPWNTTCATCTCGLDQNAVAGLGSFKKISPLLFPCFKFLILFSL
jgi:hypothetical protein